jgi:hypothetical protein
LEKNHKLILEMQDIGTMANHKIKLKQVLQHQIGDIRVTLHITGPLDASSTTSLPSKLIVYV